MATLEVEISEPLREFIERQTKQRGFESPSRYIESVLLDTKDQTDDPETDQFTAVIWDREHLEQLLLTGLNSGPSVPVDEAFWQERRRRLAARIDTK